ncbi:unnamed protein product [Rotaria socialis]
MCASSSSSILNNFSLQYLNLTIFTACPFYSTSFENPRDSGLLEIIGQSCYTSKLRYRSDYVSKIQRRGVLHSTNNPNYQYPTIRIPSPSQILSSSSNSMSSMEHCYFDEIDDLIRSSRHSATPAITNSSKVDYTTRNTTDKPQNIRLDNTRDQLKIFSARLARVEQSATPTPDLLQVNQYRSRTQLAIAHSQINNNQSASHSTQPLPLMSTQSSNNHPLILVPHVLPDQLTRTHSRSSVFIRI